MSCRSSIIEIASVFLRLGCTCFGGPIAHIGYFHADLVRKRRWLDEARFADLVSLCNFLPGPASSQFVFAVGMQRAGLAGALAASLCFLAPSLAIMIALGYGISGVPDLARAGWVIGLKIAAVAVVAHALLGMARRFCRSAAYVSMAVVAAAIVLIVQYLGAPTGPHASTAETLGATAVPTATVASPASGDVPSHSPISGSTAAFAQVAVIVASAAVGWVMGRRVPEPRSITQSVGEPQPTPSLPPREMSGQRVGGRDREGDVAGHQMDGQPQHLPRPRTLSRQWGLLCLLVFALLLFAAPPLASPSAPQLAQLADKCYRSGALVFGGGHVVLPLLRAEFVRTGDERVPSISTDEFLAGYGGAQAIPGPLFSFAGYLGTVMSPISPRWVGGVVCAGAIFLPAYLLIAGALPFWESLRTNQRARGAMDAASAAVVGVLAAALYSPVGTEGIRAWPDALVALAGLAALQLLKAPPLLVVAMCAGYGVVSG